MDLELVKDFHEICSMETLKQYLAKYNLVSRKPIVRQVYKVCTSLSNVLHEYVGIVNNLKVIVIHRWYDPSQAFSIEPDIEKIRGLGSKIYFKGFSRNILSSILYKSSCL